MVQVWYMNDSTEDPKFEHHLNPPKYVPIENLPFLTRVEVYKINVDDLDNDETFLKLITENGYSSHDIVGISRDGLKDYDKKIQEFYSEHLHDDDEIRLFLEGSGYFDVRDMFDRWLRIKAAKGDLIILPAGIYHRFTPDLTEYAKVMRLFSGKPVWTAVNRPTDGKELEMDQREPRMRHLNILGNNSLLVLSGDRGLY